MVRKRCLSLLVSVPSSVTSRHSKDTSPDWFEWSYQIIRERGEPGVKMDRKEKGKARGNASYCSFSGGMPSILVACTISSRIGTYSTIGLRGTLNLLV
jgi:hypothetical protein